jgi:hypothetical protein
MSLGEGTLTERGISEGKKRGEEEMDKTKGTSEQGERGTQKQVWKKKGTTRTKTTTEEIGKGGFFVDRQNCMA